MRFTYNLRSRHNRFLFNGHIVLHGHNARGNGDAVNADFQQQYTDNEKSIASKLDQVRRCRELATKTTSSLMVDKVQSGMKNKIETLVVKIVDLEREVETLREENADLRLQALINGIRIRRKA